MPQNFLSVDRGQDFLMPPSVRDWLPPGHLAWFVLETVAMLDLAPFYGAYRADGHGRAAHDPGMMVALLVYAYAVGQTSSRQIERSCAVDVAYRVIAGNRVPDHTTIARFRVLHEEALSGLFVKVLGLCAKVGMVRVGTIALDGTKLHANAGLGANRQLDAIRGEVARRLADAQQTDLSEDRLFGSARGDELPEDLVDPVSRDARLKRALAELEAEQKTLEDDYQALVAKREKHREKTGRNPPGRPPVAPAQRRSGRAAATPRRNITDPESRIMNYRGQRIQAYNAQAVVGENRLIVAAQLTNNASDANQLSPMITAARENLHAIGHQEKIKAILADGGYWDQQDIQTVRESNVVVIVPTGDQRHPESRETAPKQGPEADRINKILATKAGQRFYRRRASMVEPVFAHTKHTRRIDRLARRGLQAANHELQLIATTHNLLKLFRYQPQTT
jgi:transposase